MSGTWAPTPTSCRDQADPAWAGSFTGGRDRVYAGPADSGLGIEVDGGVDDGSSTSTDGWRQEFVKGCRDGG